MINSHLTSLRCLVSEQKLWWDEDIWAIVPSVTQPISQCSRTHRGSAWLRFASMALFHFTHDIGVFDTIHTFQLNHIARSGWQIVLLLILSGEEVMIHLAVVQGRQTLWTINPHTGRVHHIYLTSISSIPTNQMATWPVATSTYYLQPQKQETLRVTYVWR